jgi:hypothetical protein
MMHRSPSQTRKMIVLLLAASLVCLWVSQVTAAPVPIAHWSLDGNAKDSVGGYDGALSATGAAFVQGGITGSQALSLDKSQGGLVNLGPVIELAGISHTISLWVKTTITDYGVPFCKHHSTVAAGTWFGINDSGGYGAPNKVWFYNRDVQHSPTSSLTVNDGAWHHVVGVRNYGGDVSLYVDGQFQAAIPDQYTPAPPPGTPLLFGGYQAADGSTLVSFYTGLLDDVQIYQGALTAQQVMFLYQHPGKMIPMPWKTVPAINSLILDNGHYQ